MGSQEFAQAVRGSGSDPIATTASSAFEVDNYNEADSFTVGNGTNAYPLTLDPPEDIQYLIITETGSDIRADITTVSGTTVSDFHLRGAGLSLSSLEIANITFKDPNATGAATFGMWIGE